MSWWATTASPAAYGDIPHPNTTTTTTTNGVCRSAMTGVSSRSCAWKDSKSACRGSPSCYAATASVSSAQPPSTPRCNTSESSTTTSKAAITGPSPNQPEQPSQDQGAERGG